MSLQHTYKVGLTRDFDIVTSLVNANTIETAEATNTSFMKVVIECCSTKRNSYKNTPTKCEQQTTVKWVNTNCDRA
jgi:hypothetical protein